MSLKQIIYNHLQSQYPAWVHKGVIGKLAVNEWGYENENAGRRCRELVTSKRIDKNYNDKGEVIYRAKDPEDVCGLSQGSGPTGVQEGKLLHNKRDEGNQKGQNGLGLAFNTKELPEVSKYRI